MIYEDQTIHIKLNAAWAKNETATVVEKGEIINLIKRCDKRSVCYASFVFIHKHLNWKHVLDG